MAEAKGKTVAIEPIQVHIKRGLSNGGALDLKEGGGLRHDACDLNLRLQRERDGLELRKVHLLVVGQQGLQPLRLRTA